MKILYLPLKAKWYNMIDSGVKQEDYRDIKPYWSKRLNKQYTHVVFSYGYTKRRMTFKIAKIITGYGRTELGAPSDKEVFIIKIGLRERKVGEIFSYNGKMLEVVESDFCVGCNFRDFCSRFNGRLPAGLCIKELRSDGKSIIFKEVYK